MRKTADMMRKSADTMRKSADTMRKTADTQGAKKASNASDTNRYRAFAKTL